MLVKTVPLPKHDPEIQKPNYGRNTKREIRELRGVLQELDGNQEKLFEALDHGTGRRLVSLGSLSAFAKDSTKFITKLLEIF
jgi:hypothetical protein